MWLITTLISAVVATLLNFLIKKYRLDFLALMLWGATIMLFVDRILCYDGGEFFKKTTDGMITDSTILGIVMLLAVFIIWVISLFIWGLNKRR